MHGEYKVPGGKSMVADLGVVDEKLPQVVVLGNFSLEPNGSLGGIARALTGLSHILSVTDLATVVNSYLSKDARLFGFSPEATDIAMRHVLEYATNWDNYILGVIGPVTLGPRLYVTLDEVLATRMARSEIGPSPRIWDQDQPLVVTGSFQSYRNEIDEGGRERHSVNVV